MLAAALPASGPVRLPVMPSMPRTRAECVDGPRPCVWTRCRYHLQPDPPWGRERPLKRTTGDSCALDCADRGGMTLEEIGRALGRTRERARQIEAKALRSSRASLIGVACWPPVPLRHSRLFIGS